MYFSEQITLRNVTPILNSAGLKTGETTADTTVWADLESAWRGEYYAAQAVGKKIEAVFKVHAEDYSGQILVVYNSKVYKVERAPAKGLGEVALICSLLEA